VRRLAAQAWATRAHVEHEASLRFERLGARLANLDPASPVVSMLLEAAADERRHLELCSALATHFGGSVPTQWPTSAPSVAPRAFGASQAMTYELCAACCVTETESMATLTELLAHGASEVERTVRDIARDEVRHAQLGWAHLAREAQRGSLAFLGPTLPSMLAGTVDAHALFGPVSAELEAEALIALGVLPHSLKREVFVRTLREVVFPGLEGLGVDVGPARGWLTNAQSK
jgi:hypothetical protein